MGVVHLALDPEGRAVALKVLRSQVVSDPEARIRLTREVETLRRVRHARVAEVLDADVAGQMPYLVTRFVPGKTLDQYVRDNGPLDCDQVADLGRGLAAALQAIHAAGVVHRDIKPANVMIVDGQPVLIDFGIAHMADNSRITVTGLVMGTPGYLSPEVVDGQSVSWATDWWGWAATLAFAASGRPPFGSGPLEAVLDRVRRGAADLGGVDPALSRVLASALVADPQRRSGPGLLLSGLAAAVGPGRTGPRAARAAAASEPTLRQPPPSRARRRSWITGRGLPVPGGGGAIPSGDAGVAVTQPFPGGERPGSVPAANGAGGVVLPPPIPPQGYAAPPSTGAPPWSGIADGKHPGREPQPHLGQDTVVAPGPVNGSEPGAGGSPLAWEPAAGGPAPVRPTGTLLGVLVALSAVGAVEPVGGLVIAGLLMVVARTVDRSATALWRRRRDAGRRSGDVAIAVMSLPWHLVQALGATLLALILPVLVGISVAFIVSAGTGGSGTIVAGTPNHPVAFVLATAATLFMAWWGPGGDSLRCGARAMARVAVRRPTARTVIWVFLVLVVLSALIVLSKNHDSYQMFWVGWS